MSPSPGFSLAGIVLWTRRNLFYSAFSTVLTFVMLALLAAVLPGLWSWAVTHATMVGVSRAECGPDGACWAFIRARLPGLVFGRYPAEERWRIILAAILFVLFVIPAVSERFPRRGMAVFGLVVIYPVIAGILLLGGVFGLPFVETNFWGGLTLNFVLAYVAVVGSLPLGVLLAYGRRSPLPIVRWFSVGFIELWRGVPLLSVLFMGMVMLPLFLPGGVTVDSLIRAMVALTLFTSAYMAEIVRGGLQGIDKGQSEAASSLGLGWAQTQLLVVLPQALRLVVPGIVNTVIDLFKDTTLVTIVGLMDLLGMVSVSLKDPAWLGLAKEGYLFAAALFFVCCFGMSMYSRRLERQLDTGHRS